MDTLVIFLDGPKNNFKKIHTDIQNLILFRCKWQKYIFSELLSYFFIQNKMQYGKPSSIDVNSSISKYLRPISK